ncbi:hypothetical protein GEOBRER4_n3631 [Citrifermentans bremense]|uniref:Uncharacterized protein n=1 Tax=Citrifermentans bremense TaxID=60035 RepID=A0A6S6M2U9_9BACT|nr:hypothetical protein [Citrifermentans bremense]BCG48737.1 hypothetical protein GEOBRER4_n3631 [Citrifermentans bremense]
MTCRKSALFLNAVAFLALILAGLLVHARQRANSAAPVVAANALLARQLQLTDLCVFTETGYTRNPGITGTASAFQDSPLSLEHFPSGTLMQPPPHLFGSPRD